MVHRPGDLCYIDLSSRESIPYMARPELSLFSYEILALVGREGAGAHELLRLAKRGYLNARKEPGKTRERTVYALTEAGLEALGEHARTPVRFPAVKSDPLLRLLMCDLVGEEVTRESLATLRDDIADMWWRLDAAEESAHQLPHREQYLLMVTDF